MEIVAYGIPVTQGSMRHVGNGRLAYSNDTKLKPYRRAIRESAIIAMNGADADKGEIAVEVHFYFPRPLFHVKKEVLTEDAPISPITRSSGDLDKLCRAVGDALNEALVYVDDSQICHWAAYKHYTMSDPKTVITVSRYIEPDVYRAV